jgi:hypothetical protein
LLNKVQITLKKGCSEDIGEDRHETSEQADEEDADPQFDADVLEESLQPVLPPEQTGDGIIEILEFLGQTFVALVDVVTEVRDVIVVHLVCP